MEKIQRIGQFGFTGLGEGGLAASLARHFPHLRGLDRIPLLGADAETRESLTDDPTRCGLGAIWNFTTVVGSGSVSSADDPR